jgi:hypothetical protein
MRNQGSQGWIGVDLDATLAVYETGDGVKQIGAPIQPMVDRVKKWLAEGIQVRVFTARIAIMPGNGYEQIANQLILINAWCLEHIGEELQVTCTKDFHMIELWDDRCVQVIPNTGMPVERGA